MKPGLELRVPSPCHENWEMMSPAAKGRFCAGCSKQVVDFSLMSDAEIIRYFKTVNDKTCGRFSHDQLNRVLEQPAAPKKIWSWWMASLVWLISTLKVNGQKKEQCSPLLVGKVAVNTHDKPQPVIVKMGEVAPIPRYQTISGKIISEQGMPIISATVSIDQQKTTLTDANGRFSIETDQPQKAHKLEVSAIGFSSIERIIIPWQEKAEIVLKLSEVMLGEVVITSAPKKIILAGIVVDEKGNIIPGAYLYSGTRTLGASMDDGTFRFSVATREGKLNVWGTAPGFEAGYVSVSLQESNRKLKLVMKAKKAEPRPQEVGFIQAIEPTPPKPRLLKPFLLLTPSAIQPDPRKEVKRDVAISHPVAITPAVNANIFPNPAARGGAVYIEMNCPGRYELRLLDASGAILKTTQFTIAGKSGRVQFNLPGGMAAGLYCLSWQSENSPNPVTAKLLVQ